MQQIQSNIKKLALFVLLTTGLGACNKEAALNKAVSIQISGYNIGSTELEVSIDTVVYRNFKILPDQELNFGKIFTYPSGKNEAVLKIKDLTTGKDIYQQQLNLNSTKLELFFPFVLIDGKQLDTKPPAADPATNKLGFYIHYPQSTDAIDIFMKNDDGEMVYLAQNVQPSTWVYADYLAQESFLRPNKQYTVYFTKAGTTDTWAFNDNEYMSKIGESTLITPAKGEKGLVRTYFITPGSVDLRVVRLFKRPV